MSYHAYWELTSDGKATVMLCLYCSKPIFEQGYGVEDSCRCYDEKPEMPEQETHDS